MERIDEPQIEVQCLDTTNVVWKKVYLNVGKDANRLAVHFVPILPEALEIAPSVLNIVEIKDMMTNKFVALEISNATKMLATEILPDKLTPPCEGKYDSKKDVLSLIFTIEEKAKQPNERKAAILYDHNKEGRIISLHILNASKVL